MLISRCITSLLISGKYNKKDFRLYRDYGLGVVKNKSGPETEKVKKNIQKIFKENKLDIIIQCNMKIVNYVDVSFNLNNSNYKPYHKPDNEILYIDKDSNHPPSIIKQAPTPIKKRISILSCNETILITNQKKYTKKFQKNPTIVKL